MLLDCFRPVDFGVVFLVAFVLGGEVKGEENGSLQACPKENGNSTIASQSTPVTRLLEEGLVDSMQNRCKAICHG